MENLLRPTRPSPSASAPAAAEAVGRAGVRARPDQRRRPRRHRRYRLELGPSRRLRASRPRRDAALQREGALRARPRSGDARPPRPRGDRLGACRAPPLPRARHADAGGVGARARHRRAARGGERTRVHRLRRADHGRAGIAPLRRRGGAPVGPRRHLRHPQSRRHRRRSRRRQPRGDRHPQGADRHRRDVSARRPPARGSLGEAAQEGREDRCREPRRLEGAAIRREAALLRDRRHLAVAGAAAHAPEGLSAPRHASVLDSGGGGGGLLPHGRPPRDRIARTRSRSSRATAGRCFPTAPRSSIR